MTTLKRREVALVCMGAERGVRGAGPGPGGAAGRTPSGAAIGERSCNRLSVPPVPRRLRPAMAAPGVCPGCGSAALVEDAHYAQQQLVCAACGCVLAEGLLTTTYTDEEHLRGAAPGPGGLCPPGNGGGVVPGVFAFSAVENSL